MRAARPSATRAENLRKAWADGKFANRKKRPRLKGYVALDPETRHQRLADAARQGWQNGRYDRILAASRERRQTKAQRLTAYRERENARKLAIIDAYQNGIRPFNILRDYNITGSSLYRLLKMAGIKVSYASNQSAAKAARAEQGRKWFSDQTKRRVIQRVLNGESVRQIAATEKPNKVTINRWIKKAGIVRIRRGMTYRIANREAAD